MNIYTNVKEVVSTLDAASFYGISVNRKGMCRCPFHNDRNPSMKLGTYFYCFGCGEKGDVINFVAKLFGMSQYEAAKKIAADFGVPGSNLTSCHPKPAQPCPPSQNYSVYTFKKAFNKYLDDCFSILLEYYRHLQAFQTLYEPKTAEELDFCHPHFEEAVHNLPRIDWMLDEILFGDMEQQIEFLNTYKGEIENVKKRNNELR